MKKQGFLTGSIILMASVAVAKVLGALFKIPLTALLGGTGMGYYSAAYGLFLPAYAICVTGLPAAMAKATAENAALSQTENIRRLRKSSLALFSLVGFLATGLMTLLARPFAVTVLHMPGAYPAILAMAPSVFLGCVLAVYRGYYEGLRNMTPTAVSQVIEGVMKLAGGLFSAYYLLYLAQNRPVDFLRLCKWIPGMRALGFQPSVEELALPVAAAGGIFGVTLGTAAALLFLALRCRFGKENGPAASALEPGRRLFSGQAAVSPGPPAPSSQLLSGLIQVLIPIAAGSLVTNLTGLIDLSTIMRGVENALSRGSGQYQGLLEQAKTAGELPGFIYGSFTGLALTIFNIVPAFTNMFGKGALPALTEAWALRDKKQVKKTAGGVLLATAVTACPLGIGIAALPRQILTFLFPGQTEEILICLPAMPWLGLAVIPLALTAPLFAMLQAMGRADLPVWLMLPGILLKLAGNLLLVPAMGVTGAAISTLACYGVILTLGLICFLRLADIRLNLFGLLGKPFCAALLCGAGAGVGMGFLERNLESSFFCLVFSIGIGGIIYVFTLYLTNGIGHNE